LALLSFRRGLLLIALCFGLQFQPIEVVAAEVDINHIWHDMWHTANKQAEALMVNKQYKQASVIFKNPAWKMAAHYRDKNYAAALDDFHHIAKPSVEDIYNKANVLAKLGKLDAAIVAYDEVLKRQPQHQDAKTNKALLEKMQQQQKQHKSSQDKSKSDKKKSPKHEPNKQNAGKPQNKDQQASQPQSNDAKTQNQSSKSKAKKNATKPDEMRKNKLQQEQTKAKSQKQLSKQPKLSDDELKKLEVKQNFEQTLRRVPDDPGGLLRRKFLYQYKQQAHEPASQGDIQW